MELYLAAAGGVVLGTALCYLAFIRGLLKQLRALQGEKYRLEQEQVRLQTTMEGRENSWQEKMEMLKSSREELKREFENLSNKIYQSASQRLVQENRSTMDSVLSPFKQQLSEFRERIDRVYDSEAKDRRTLYDEIINLKELNQHINEEAARLSQALKGDTKKQGAWGELVLSRILEESGLRRGEEYEQQASFTDEEGLRKRPDVIVHLPEDKDIIIDSKVSLTAYEEYVSSDDPEEERSALQRHILSIKQHVRELSDKSYEEIRELRTLDYVLMFIPIESAFMCALEHDRSLFNEAYRRNIIIVSPSTLLVTLRTIGNIWRYERQNTNAQEIAERAGKLYDKLAGFVESLEDVGTNLNRSQASLDQAMNRLSRGRGNLISQAETLRALGAKNRKQISTPGLETEE